MKKKIYAAIMAVSCMVSFNLSMTSAFATDSSCDNQVEEFSNASIAMIKSLGFSEKDISQLRTSKIADSFAVYTIQEPANTGHQYRVKTSVGFNDYYVNYCGCFIGNAADQSEDTSGMGWETVATNNTYTASSNRCTFSALKFFWDDDSLDIDDVLDNPIITQATDLTTNTNIPSSSYSTYFSYNKIGLGDINGNGIVNQTDVNLLVDFLTESNNVNFTAEQKLAADANCSGGISDADLTAILYWMASSNHNPVWTF